MRDETARGDDGLLGELAAVIEGHGAEATRGESSELVAREWIGAGFDDPEEVAEWLAARCFTAAGARLLDDAGITPAQAATLTREGASPVEETIGFKVTRGELSVEAARRIVTDAFWNK